LVDGARRAQSAKGCEAADLFEIIENIASFFQKSPVIAKLTYQRFDASEIGRYVTERRGDFSLDGSLALAHGFRQANDGVTLPCTARFGERFAPLHHFHQQRGIGARPVGFVCVTPVTH
jgi:hypothetical protein